MLVCLFSQTFFQFTDCTLSSSLSPVQELKSLLSLLYLFFKNVQYFFLSVLIEKTSKDLRRSRKHYLNISIISVPFLSVCVFFNNSFLGVFATSYMFIATETQASFFLPN